MKEDITATIHVSRKTDIQSIAHDLLSEKSESSQQPKALFLFLPGFNTSELAPIGIADFR